MKKPLWSFFCILRERTPLILSVDHYLHFHQAFLEIPQIHIQTYHDLRDFCKLFWLQEPEYENEFNYLYDTWVNWEKLKEPWKDVTKATPVKGGSPQTDTPPSNDSMDKGSEREIKPIKEGGGKQNDNMGKEKEEINFEPNEPLKHNEEEWVDFNLVIREEEEGVGTAPFRSPSLENSFHLDNRFIQAFNTRFLSQRLRRKVESSFKEPTDELHVEKMIQQFCIDRYLDKILFKTKECGSSHIVLLANRYGSMLAYEFIEKQLVEAISLIPECTFEHYCYDKLPLYDEQLHQYELRNVQEGQNTFFTKNCHWTPHTWFFIFSDAGGQSQLLDMDEVDASWEWWNYLKGYSEHVYWINPVTPDRCEDSTVESLSFIIPMIYPHQEDWIAFFNTQ